MKSEKKSKYTKINKTTYLLAFVAVLSFTTSLFLYNKNEPQTISIPVAKHQNIMPKMYSDSHITQNAIESNPEYKNIAVFDREILLANLVSSVKKNSTKVDSGPENGTWLWTPILEITPEYRKKIISGAVKNNIKNIYLSIDSYLDIYIMPDGKEKTEKRLAFDKQIEDFISEANKNGISVDAEAGWRNWAQEGHTYKAFATLKYAIDFNKKHEKKFRGFQYDVEPYLLDEYKKDKKTTLTNFLNLISQSVSALNNSDLDIAVVIPEFYDGTNNDTPKFSYRGTMGFATEHLLEILDRRENSKIIVMSYRNFSQGENGSIDISKNEIASAEKHRTKVVLAQESGDVEPPYITFYNTSKRRYNKETQKLEEAFKDTRSFDGLAVHYINSFMDLR